MLVGIIICAMFNPSFVSCFFVLLSCNLIYMASYSPKTRLFWGQIILYLNIVVLVVMVCYKATFLSGQDGEKAKGKKIFTYTSRESMVKDAKFYESFGFSINKLDLDDGWLKQNDKSNLWMSQDTNMTIHLAVMNSFVFEFFILVIYLMGTSRYHSLTKKINNLEKDFIKVTMVKIYENRSKEEEDSDYEGEDGTIGTMDTSVVADQIKEKEYKKDMRKYSSEIKRVYLDSEVWTKRSKIYFLALIIIQLMQSMVFNGVLDVPFLLLILILGALYAFRQAYFLPFQYMIISVAYYINFIAIIKFAYLICTKVAFVRDWFKSNPDDTFSIMCKVLFGINFSTYSGASFSQTELIYYVLLTLCIFISQAYKQTKWADVRATTYNSLNQGDSEWAFETMNRYLILRTEIKEVTQLKKKADKAEFKKSGRKGKFASGGNLYTGFKKDLNKFLPIVAMWTLRIMLTFQIYMYHTGISLVHLMYVLLTFIIPIKIAFYFTIVVMLPLYICEFIMVYGAKIQYLKDKPEFTKFGVYFNNIPMKSPMLEQTLYFLILTNFFVMISCFKL